MELLCPRCAMPLEPPTLTEHQYRCPVHGDVPGAVPAIAFDPPTVARVAARSEVPIWYPHPVPPSWLLSGVRWAQTPRGNSAAVAVGMSGHGLTDGPTDVVIVAEQPGCGFGAGYAGLDGTDPDPSCFDSPPAARIRTDETATGLWSVPTPDDRVAFVGEADGNWLWIIGWPATAWSLVADDLRLRDGRLDDRYHSAPTGALNPRLDGGGQHGR